MKASEITRNAGRQPREIELVERLTGALPRSRDQVNGRHHSDAELVRLPPGERLLAITTDAISEEIETGLYEDPHLIGWMAVAAAASDLAAVGAEPLGVLLSESLPVDVTTEFERALQQGIADACAATGLAVLGGDTNRSRHLHVGATAVGSVPAREALTRRGVRPGDALFASGRLGAGGAYALARLVGSRFGGPPSDGPSAVPFRPRPRLREGRLLRRFGSACMDSSDGLIPTLDELIRLNGVGFDLQAEPDEVLEAGARALARRAGLPGWMLLAGPHGEFELIFTVPAARIEAFLEAARGIGWCPIRLGHAVGAPRLRLPIGGRVRALDTTAVRDLFDEAGGDPAAYLAALWAIHSSSDDASAGREDARGGSSGAPPRRRES